MIVIMVAVFFFDFQKAFDIVDHNVLLKQLEHSGSRGISNKCFACYQFCK